MIETVLISLGSTLVTTITGLVSTLLVKKIKKAGREEKKEKEEQTRKAIREAVAWVTEWAAKKKKYDRLIVSGEVKLNKALSRLTQKIEDVTGEDLETMIHEELAWCGEGATNVGFEGAKEKS